MESESSCSPAVPGLHDVVVLTIARDRSFGAFPVLPGERVDLSSKAGPSALPVSRLVEYAREYLRTWYRASLRIVTRGYLASNNDILSD